MMHLGRRDESALKLPDLGAMLARELGQQESEVPDYVAFYTATEGRNSGQGQSGFLGARYAPMFLTTESKPANLARLESLTSEDQHERELLREFLEPRIFPTPTQRTDLVEVEHPRRTLFTHPDDRGQVGQLPQFAGNRVRRELTLQKEYRFIG